MDAAIRSAKAVRVPGTVNRSPVRIFGCLFNASSRLVIDPFIVLSAQGGMVFP
jgi:hypothetical protein